MMVALGVGGVALALTGARQVIAVAALAAIVVVLALAPVLLRRRQSMTSSSPTEMVPEPTTSA